MTDDYFDKDCFRVPREDAIFVSVEAYDALAARLAEAERALIKIVAHTGTPPYAERDLLVGLLKSIARIAEGALSRAADSASELPPEIEKRGDEYIRHGFDCNWPTGCTCGAGSASATSAAAPGKE